VNLTDFRTGVAQALGTLGQVQAGTWAVHPAPPDLVDPPAYVCDWADPMDVNQSMCTDVAELFVVVVGARFADAAANYPTVEAMVDAARPALTAAGFRPWQILRPVRFPMGQLEYLAARMQIRQPIAA